MLQIIYVITNSVNTVCYGVSRTSSKHGAYISNLDCMRTCWVKSRHLFTEVGNLEIFFKKTTRVRSELQSYIHSMAAVVRILFILKRIRILGWFLAGFYPDPVVLKLNGSGTLHGSNVAGKIALIVFTCVPPPPPPCVHRRQNRSQLREGWGDNRDAQY